MSGLDWQVAPIAFTKGLDTKTAAKLVIPGKWRQLINYTLSEDDALTRRDGISLLASGNGNGLATHNDKLLVVAGPSVSVVGAAVGRIATLPTTTRIGYVDIDKAEVQGSTRSLSDSDIATGFGFVASCWVERNLSAGTIGVRCSVVDEVSGSSMTTNFAMRTSATVISPRVVFNGTGSAGAFYFFYIDGTSLYCRVIAVTSPNVVGSEVALITSASLPSTPFDAIAFGANSGAMVAYIWNDGVTSVRTIEVVRAGTVPSIGLGPTDLMLAADATTFTAITAAAYSGGANAAVFTTSIAGAALGLNGVVIDSGLWAVTTPRTQLSATVNPTAALSGLTAVQDSTNLRVFRDYRSEWNTAAFLPIEAIVVNFTLATIQATATVASHSTYATGAATARGVQGPFIHGKAFVTGGRIFLPVFIGSTYAAAGLAASNPRTLNQQNTFFVLDNGTTGGGIDIAVVVAKALAGSYGIGGATAANTLPAMGTATSSPESATAGRFFTLSGELTRLVLTSQAVNLSPVALVRLSMRPSFTRGASRAQLGETTYLSGGQVMGFDGAEAAEHGFPYFPEGIQVTDNGAGTGTVTNGTHQIVVVYEWVDNAGQRHQSAPCPAVTITTGTAANTHSFTVNVPTILLSQKYATGGVASDIQLVAYMTQAGGLTLNRVLLDNAVYAQVMNSTAASSVAITIDDSDATIAGNELLYTQPNQAGTTLPNIAPGPTDAITVAHNRLWYKKSDQPGAFGFSQEYVNNLGLQFSPDLGGMLPLDAGPLVAIEVMDEKIILLCKRRPFVMFGSGPQPSGAFSNYSKPEEIASDVGCIEARSVVSTPMGIMFQAQNGIHLLGRDLSVSWIGEDAAGLTQGANGPVAIYAATLLADRKEVRFVSRFFNDAGQFLTLVYSYAVNQWSMFLGVTAQAYGIADALWWPAWPTTGTTAPGSYVHVSTGSALNYDNPATYADTPGGAVAATCGVIAKTSWLKVSALEGFQRVKRIYVTASNDSGVAPVGTLTLAVAYDDLDTGAPGAYSTAIPLATVSPTALTSVDIRHKLRHMKCKSVSFTFTEAPAGQPLTGMQALALEVGIKRGVNKLPLAQTVA